MRPTDRPSVCPPSSFLAFAPILQSARGYEVGGREEWKQGGKEGGLLPHRASNISRLGRALNAALTKKISPQQTLPGTALMHRAVEFGPEAPL